jgi:hypothetical protein
MGVLPTEQLPFATSNKYVKTFIILFLFLVYIKDFRDRE